MVKEIKRELDNDFNNFFPGNDNNQNKAGTMDLKTISLMQDSETVYCSRAVLNNHGLGQCSKHEKEGFSQLRLSLSSNYYRGILIEITLVQQSTSSLPVDSAIHFH